LAGHRTDLADGYRRQHHEAVGSTNDLGRRAAASGAADGLIITAERQDAGRGRHGRHWQSAPGGLYLSVLKRPGLLPDGVLLSQVSLVSGVALVEALQPHCRRPLSLKWPNDVLAPEGKLAGVLVETAPNEAVIIGIGVNLDTAPDVPDRPTASLAGPDEPVDGELILSDIIASFDRCWRLWLRDGFTPIRDTWTRHGPAFGTPIAVRAEKYEEKGSFAGLDSDGALLLQPPDRPSRRVAAGEVCHG